jgi:alpha-L-rhamnosidase
MIKISTIASAVLFLTLGIAASPSRVAATALPAGFVPTALRCELRQNPLGIDRLSPSLSWICSAVSAVPRGEMQTAYQMRVASTREGLNGPACDLWDTGKVLSSESCNIVYAGKPLVSGQDAYWKVRVWNRNGQVSPWSAPAFWSMGLLRPSDWQAVDRRSYVGRLVQSSAHSHKLLLLESVERGRASSIDHTRSWSGASR